MMEFILNAWLYMAFLFSGAMAMHLWVNRKELSTQKMLFGLVVATLPFHMAEERVLPGGFHWIYNIAFPGDIVQTQLGVFVCNVLVLIVLVLVFWKFADKPWAAVFAVLFCFAEFVHHTREAVMTMQMFDMSIPYSPGWITSILQFCIFIALVRWLLHSKSLSVKNILAGLIATMFFSACCVATPVFVFNDSAYHFPDNGFYEQFGVEDIGS